MTTTVDLIERGFFPDELPPPFTTHLLSQSLSSLQPVSSYGIRSSRYIPYDIPRVKLQPILYTKLDYVMRLRLIGQICKHIMQNPSYL